MSTINTLKEQSGTWQPLLLHDFSFSDGTALHLCTHGLNPSESGVSSLSYSGTQYMGRIAEQSIEQIAAQGNEGIDRIPSIEFKMADADAVLTAYEIAHGWKGCQVTLKLVYFQVGTTNFSTDSRIMFIGICDPPIEMNDRWLSVKANNKLLMQKKLFPQFPVQRRCPKYFPQTAADRLAVCTSGTAQFEDPNWCRYSADQAGGNARGNLNGGVAFTNCGYVKSDCLARGMY